jgi:alpha-glucosidase
MLNHQIGAHRFLSFCAFALALSWATSSLAQTADQDTSTIRSPDGTIAVKINHHGELTYAVAVDHEQVLAPSRLGLLLHDGTKLGGNVQLLNSHPNKIDDTWTNRFGKNSTVHNRCNRLLLLLLDQSAVRIPFELEFRVYDDGVAFRYLIPERPGLGAVVLDRDFTEFTFPDDYPCFAGEHAKKFRSSQEWTFDRQHLSDIKPYAVKGLPVLVQTPAAWVAVAESDLLDWSGMWIGGAEQPAGGTERPASAAEQPAGDASQARTAVTLVAKLAPRLDGLGVVYAVAPCHSSWRVLAIAREPRQLIESELIENLATHSFLSDISWIKPGKMAWDHWWTGDTIMDTATIESYIQLAADMGWPYQLIDWQWYGTPDKPDADITQAIPALDMDAVRQFARDRNVRLWLWLHSNDVDRNDAYKKAFPLYEKWGIAGVKIDFMDRDDQEMVNWYEKITRAAAEHHLMVNFHGAFKPCGFERTYPNQITREGILGNEYNKWSKLVTPEHKLTLPFTRFLEGPADFTPGGFLNRQPKDFQANVKPTQAQGTRAAELALFVCFDSPLCCVCDAPDHIRDQPGSDFLKLVPTVWDETRALDGEVGGHLVVVRRSGEEWYLGAMLAGGARALPVKLDFLGSGRWQLTLWHDASDCDEHAEHLVIDDQGVTADDTLTLNLAPNGGCVGHFHRQ